MATLNITAQEAITNPEYRKFRLCFVDRISKTYTDYTPESKKLMETEEYKNYIQGRREYLNKILEKLHYVSSKDYDYYDRLNDPTNKFRTEMQEFPSPDYVAGYTHYLYFTDNIDKQWGDDWDDAPYEYNAGEPYDDNTNIIIIPVKIVPLSFDYDNEDSMYNEKIYDNYPNVANVDVKLPCDYAYNSPFCIDDINGGAVAWIYALSYKYKDGKRTRIAINSQDTPETAYYKIERINNLCK